MKIPYRLAIISSLERRNDGPPRMALATLTLSSFTHYVITTSHSFAAWRVVHDAILSIAQTPFLGSLDPVFLAPAVRLLSLHAIVLVLDLLRDIHAMPV